VADKFERLSASSTEPPLCRDIMQAVTDLESIMVADLTKLLAKAGTRH